MNHRRGTVVGHTDLKGERDPWSFPELAALRDGSDDSRFFDPSKNYQAVCPNGHIHNLNRDEMERTFGEETVDQIDRGVLLDAPVVDRDECLDCLLGNEHKDRDAVLLDLTPA